MSATDAKKLERLRTLLADYSYAERRRPGMLTEIDALLVWALREMIRPDVGPEEVRALLGPPHGTVGEESEEFFRWLYPSAFSVEEAGEASEWFFTLSFQGGKLRSIERTGWTD